MGTRIPDRIELLDRSRLWYVIVEAYRQVFLCTMVVRTRPWSGVFVAVHWMAVVEIPDSLAPARFCRGGQNPRDARVRREHGEEEAGRLIAAGLRYFELAKKDLPALRNLDLSSRHVARRQARHASSSTNRQRLREQPSWSCLRTGNLQSQEPIRAGFALFSDTKGLNVIHRAQVFNHWAYKRRPVSQPD